VSQVLKLCRIALAAGAQAAAPWDAASAAGVEGGAGAGAWLFLAGTVLSLVNADAQSGVLLLWGAANRDPAQFDAPEEFRLDRSTGKGHMTFGKGLHFCLGAPLARLEAATVLRLLLDRTTWFEAAAVGPWLPSVLARRREYLQLSVR
jgi:hypothetical protein